TARGQLWGDARSRAHPPPPGQATPAPSTHRRSGSGRPRRRGAARACDQPADAGKPAATGSCRDHGQVAAMNTDARDRAPPLGPATELLVPGDPSAGSTGEVLRLLLAPVLVTVMLVGGYYWLHQQPAGPAEHREAATTVAVRLLPEPVVAPIPVTPAPRRPTETLASRTDVSPDKSDRAKTDTMAVAEPPREAIPPVPP